MAADTMAWPMKNDAGTTLFTFNLPLFKLDATTAPTTANDDTQGYVAGSIWVDRTNDKVYICTDNATGAAVWVQIAGAGSGGSHTLLNGSVHTDSASAACAYGSMIVGNATSKWDALALGAANALLCSNGTTVVWFGSTAAGLALLDDADAAAQRTTLGLGALATLATVGTGQIDNDAVTYAKLQNASATARVLARKTAAAGDYEECTASEVLDFLGNSPGDILFRGATGWTKLAGGTAGSFLTTQGASDPTWTALPAATQAEQEAGSVTTAYTTPGRQHFHPSALKWWCRFDTAAGTPTIQSDFNVLDLTDNGVGNITINIETDFSGTTWAPGFWGELQYGALNAMPNVNLEVAPAAGTVQIRTATGTPSAADTVIFTGWGMGDQ